MAGGTAARSVVSRMLAVAAMGALVAGPAALSRGGAPAPGATVLLRDRQASQFTLHKNDCPPSNKAQENCNQTDTEIEPSIAVNPANTLNAVVVFQSGRQGSAGDTDNGWATTFDGGNTWIHGLLPGLTKAVGGPFDRASDAVVAFGPNNTVYANSLVFNFVTHDSGLPEPLSGAVFDALQATGAAGPSLRSGLAVNVSHDGGRTWGAPVILQDDKIGGLIDKNWIVVDNGTGAGHHTGRVYVVWDRVVPLLAAYSDDGGATWNGCGPAAISEAGSADGPYVSGAFGCVIYPSQGIGALPMVAPNGDLDVLFETDVAPAPVLHPSAGEELAEPVPGVTKIMLATAPLAGSLPTGAPLVFTPAISAAVDDSNGVRQQRASDGIPATAMDPATGTVYVVWDDARFRGDSANDIVIVSSKDGVTWTSPVRVNPGPTNDEVDHFNPSVSVGPNGEVRVAYRQRKEAATEAKDGSTFDRHVFTYFHTSKDGGATWSAPLRVNTPDSDMDFGAQSRNGTFLGDYEASAAAGALTYVVHIEPQRLNAREPRTFPPVYHHQRTWVAVVGPASALGSGSPATAVFGERKTSGGAKSSGGTLPSTGIEDTAPWATVVALGIVAAALSRRLRQLR